VHLPGEIDGNFFYDKISNHIPIRKSNPTRSQLVPWICGGEFDSLSLQSRQKACRPQNTAVPRLNEICLMAMNAHALPLEDGLPYFVISGNPRQRTKQKRNDGTHPLSLCKVGKKHVGPKTQQCFVPMRYAWLVWMRMPFLSRTD